MKNLDTRQSVNRSILQQLFPWVGDQDLDILLTSINAELTPPLGVDANNPASLIVNVNPSVITNPESNRNRSVNFIDQTIPMFAGGTVTFPSSSGGNITASTGSTATLTLPATQFCTVLLSLDSSGDIQIQVGTAESTETLALENVPIPNATYLPFAYIVVSNIGGTIQNIAQSAIYQFGDAAAGSINGVANQVSLTSGVTSVVVTLPFAFADTSFIVVPNFGNYTDADPQFQPITIVNKTTNTFTAEWNAPLSSANYYLQYIVTGNVFTPPASPYSARLANLADIYVGSPTDVSNGYADYSSLASAVANALSGQKIKIRSNLTITESVTISKQVMIEGSGYSTYIDGTIALTSASYCTLTNFRSTMVTLNSSSNGNIIQSMFWTSSPTDSGSGNSINGVEVICTCWICN
jgi:hypothetical protein